MNVRPSRSPSPSPLAKSLVSVAALACLCASVACGGRTLESEYDGGGATPNANTNESSSSSSSSSSSGGSSGGNGSSSGTAFPICPDLEPKAGWSCSSPNLGCAYVNYDTGVCTSVVCDSSGHWATSTPAGC